MSAMKHILFMLAIALTDCSQAPTPVPNPPPEPVPADVDYCVSAGQNVEKVCPKLAKTPAGKSFEQFCKDKVKQDLPMNPKCVMTAHNCDEINVCTGSN
jgi:hypothetical protein